MDVSHIPPVIWRNDLLSATCRGSMLARAPFIHKFFKKIGQGKSATRNELVKVLVIGRRA